MKYLFLIAIILSSCINNKTADSPALETPKVDSGSGQLALAKKLADSIFYYVELADKDLITKKELKSKADPWQKQQDSLRYHVLTIFDVQELDAYRTKLVSQMVDRKVERDNKR